MDEVEFVSPEGAGGGLSAWLTHGRLSLHCSPFLGGHGGALPEELQLLLRAVSTHSRLRGLSLFSRFVERFSCRHGVVARGAAALTLGAAFMPGTFTGMQSYACYVACINFKSPTLVG